MYSCNDNRQTMIIGKLIGLMVFKLSGCFSIWKYTPEQHLLYVLNINEINGVNTYQYTVLNEAKIFLLWSEGLIYLVKYTAGRWTVRFLVTAVISNSNKKKRNKNILFLFYLSLTTATFKIPGVFNPNGPKDLILAQYFW